MKKMISILLTAVLLAGCFYGCTKEDESDAFVLKNTVDTHYSDTADQAVIRSYEKLCSAVEAGDSEVKISASMVDSVSRLFYTCYPMFTLVKTMQPLPDNSGFTITYTKDAEAHRALVSAFKEKVKGIMEACGYGTVNRNAYIFNVYTYITKNFTLDSTATTTYDTILNEKGIASYINSAFEYLVLQGGGQASHAVNYTGSSIMISAVSFNGNWYFFDPGKEISDNAGASLNYFAMNSTDVKAIYSTAAFLYTDGEKMERFKDKSFEKLRNAVSYTIADGKAEVKIAGEDKTFSVTFR